MIRALILATAGVVFLACGGDRGGPSHGVVATVIDGDTITLESGEKIRYLMVDAPETTNGHTDCWGQQAKAFNEDAVLGREIELKYDTECTDRFGRLLAYVTVGGRELNSTMVEKGMACLLHI